MPVHACRLDGKPGYQWGGRGACYTYTPGDEAGRKEAKRKAYLQGAAAEAHGADKQLTTGDVHVATAIGTSLRQRRRKGDLPDEIPVVESFVAFGPEVAGRTAVWIRSDRHLLAKTFAAVAREAAVTETGALPEGYAPLYDLILKYRPPYDPEDEPVEPEPDTFPARTLRLLKGTVAAPQQKVLGIVLEPGVVDSQGDFEDPAEIEAACHQFANDYRLMKTHVGLGHQRLMSDDEATVVENYIAPADLQVGGEKVAKGSWLQMVHVKNPAVWKAIEAGELTGFSFGGSGYRQYVPEEQTP